MPRQVRGMHAAARRCDLQQPGNTVWEKGGEKEPTRTQREQECRKTLMPLLQKVAAAFGADAKTIVARPQQIEGCSCQGGSWSYDVYVLHDGSVCLMATSSCSAPMCGAVLALRSLPTAYSILEASSQPLSTCLPVLLPGLRSQARIKERAGRLLTVFCFLFTVYCLLSSVHCHLSIAYCFPSSVSTSKNHHSSPGRQDTRKAWYSTHSCPTMIPRSCGR